MYSTVMYTKNLGSNIVHNVYTGVEQSKLHFLVSKHKSILHVITQIGHLPITQIAFCYQPDSLYLLSKQ